MQLIDIFAYVAVLIPFTVSPGPLIAAIIARSAAGDSQGAIEFSIGMTLGYVGILGLVCFGLGVWLQSVPQLLDFIKVFAMLYFFWIAYGIWNAGSSEIKDASRNASLFGAVIAGLTTSMASPHVILFFIMFTPQLVDVENLTIAQFSIASVVTMLALAVCLGGVIFAVLKCKSILNIGGDSNLVNRSMAVMIGMAGVWMVAG
ncbi:MAG: LysE family transporter [Pseudorhodobacter sp.]